VHEKQKMQRANTAKGQNGTGDQKARARDARRKVEELEKRVATLEARVTELSKQLEDPALYTTNGGGAKAQKMGKELDEARRGLDRAIDEWTRATEEAERLAVAR
jgi:predicted  nucleic acid-binding Zn-ribbon protein